MLTEIRNEVDKLREQVKTLETEKGKLKYDLEKEREKLNLAEQRRSVSEVGSGAQSAPAQMLSGHCVLPDWRAHNSRPAS